jgi:2-hydroxychromene-2-carboxylate isomerase
VEFFYCCSCPWTYLAFVRLNETALRTDSTIVYRPIIADWVRARRTGGSPADGSQAAIAAYARKDLQDWARFCGVRIVVPTPTPTPEPPEWAQRGAIVAVEAGRGKGYLTEIFRGRFEDRIDVADRAVVLEVAARCGLQTDDFAARIDAVDTIETLHRNGDELQQRGGFASPTLFIGDDMYVGHDRMPLLESALMRASDRPFIAPGEHDRN